MRVRVKCGSRLKPNILFSSSSFVAPYGPKRDPRSATRLPKEASEKCIFFENYTTPCQERVSAACAAANKGTCNNGFRRKKEFFFPPPRRANSLLPSAAPSSLSFFRKKCFFP